MARPSTSRQLIIGSLYRNAQLFVLLGATFAMTPVIVHSLGDRMYGFWTLIGAIIGYYGLLDFGLTSAAERYIAQSLGKGDVSELNDVANTAFFLFFLIGSAALLATILASAACPFFIREPAERALFRRIILLLGTATAVGFPFKVYSGVLTSYIRYDVIACISITRTVLSNAAIYHYLGEGGGIMSLAVIGFAVSALQSAATGAVCAALYPHIKIVFFRFDASRIRAMFDHSWKNFVCQIGDILRFRIDSLLIAGFLSVSLVTPYAVGVRLIEGFNQLVMSSIGMMLPVFSRYEGRGDYDSIRSALLKVTKLSALLSAFIGGSIIFYARPLILRWMGAGYESSYYVAAILCVAYMIELPQSPGIQLLYGLSKHDAYAALNTCEAALNVVLSVALLRRFGMYGVVLGTAVEIVVVKLFVLPIYICRPIGLPVRDYVLDAMLGTLLKSAVPLGVFYFVIRRFLLPDYSRLAACVAAQTLLFVPAAYFVIIGEDDRRFINRAVRSVFERAAARPAESFDGAS